MPRTRSEVGAVGLPLFSGYLSLDPNARLRGVPGIKIYREMMYDDPACAAFLAACNTLLRTDLQVEPGGTTDNDKRAAEFLGQCLQDMRDPLQTTMRQINSFIAFGWSMQEQVFKRRTGGHGSRYDDGKIGWAAFAPRRQESMYRWEHEPNGAITGWAQRPAPDFQIRKLWLKDTASRPAGYGVGLHFVADDSEGSPEGRSALRGMYKPSYFAKNLELLWGISMERFGTGIPIFQQTVDADVTAEHLALFDAIAIGLRQNEEAYLRVPFGYEFRFAPSPGLEADNYRTAILFFRTWALSTALAEFISLGTGDTGSFALGKSKIDLFLRALTGYQDRVTATINRDAVPRLFRYNDFGTLTELPKVTLPAVREYDLQGLATFAQILEKIGLFHPTPADEALMRKISDLVDIDDATLKALHDEDAQKAEDMAEQFQPNEGDTPDTGGDVASGEDDAPMMEDGNDGE